MSDENLTTGILYASSNISVQGGLKLGKTRNKADFRAKTTVTGSPYPMVVVVFSEFRVSNDKELLDLEAKMHRHPSIRRHRWRNNDGGGGKEWFRIDVETVKSVMRELQMEHMPTRSWLAFKDQEIAKIIEKEKLAKQAEILKLTAERAYYILLKEHFLLRGFTDYEAKENTIDPVNSIDGEVGSRSLIFNILKKYNYSLEITRNSFEWERAKIEYSIEKNHRDLERERRRKEWIEIEEKRHNQRQLKKVLIFFGIIAYLYWAPMGLLAATVPVLVILSVLSKIFTGYK